MELLLIATYTAICVAVFKIFRIPVTSGRCRPRCSAVSS